METLSSGLRQRKTVLKTIKEFDAFPKVPDTYQETSTSGGTVSILAFLFIGILVISEFLYYTDKITKYSYEVDADADHKIRINVDLTVAMECDDIGADVLDVSGSSIDTTQLLKLEPTWFKMSKNQQIWWESFRMVRKHDEEYRSINDVTNMETIFGEVLPTYMPEKDKKEFADKDFDACRIYGNVEVNKVAGNFHITAGKSIPHPRGHAHLSSLVSELNYNFSHRIDLLSFGDPHPGIINPLDGDLQLTETGYQMYQYYIKIVPTSIQTFKHNMKTYQYSVTQRSRVINHGKGSHGVPGIFFKYNLNSICVNVKEKFRDFGQFLVRLCGIIGGVFATSGMMHSFIGFLTDLILCKLRERNKGRRMTTDSKDNVSFPLTKSLGNGGSSNFGQTQPVSLVPTVNILPNSDNVL